jgi:hypothetical protein
MKYFVLDAVKEETINYQSQENMKMFLSITGKYENVLFKKFNIESFEKKNVLKFFFYETL